jgi:hypothetical protein
VPSLALAFIDAEILERSFPASSCRTIPLGSSAGDRACLLMRGGGDARPVPAPADHAPLQLGCFPSRHPSTIGRDATRTIDVPEVLLEAVRSLEPERMTTIRGLPAHFSRAEAGHSSRAPKPHSRVRGKTRNSAGKPRRPKGASNYRARQLSAFGKHRVECGRDPGDTIRVRRRPLNFMRIFASLVEADSQVPRPLCRKPDAFSYSRRLSVPRPAEALQ